MAVAIATSPFSIYELGCEINLPGCKMDPRGRNKHLGGISSKVNNFNMAERQGRVDSGGG